MLKCIVKKIETKVTNYLQDISEYECEREFVNLIEIRIF